MARPSLRKIWTAEEDELLKQMLAAGKSHSVIAIRLKRAVGAVSARVKLLEAAGRRGEAETGTKPA